jgi:pimeloyl-ACP methyl ester carboxylesterase
MLGGTPEQIAAGQAAFQRVVAALKSNAPLAELSAAVRDQIGAQFDARTPERRAALGDRTAFIDRTLPSAVTSYQLPWLRAFITFDPAPVLATVRCPALVVFGERDTQVPPSTNRPPLEAAFAKGGNTNVTIKVYPEANHLFIAAKTGQASEYAMLPKVFVPGFLTDVSNWILAMR